MKFFLVVTFLLIQSKSFGLSFEQAIKNIQEHEVVKGLEHLSDSLNSESRMKSSWGDPMLKVAAKNFPIDTLKNDQTPMTGVEFGFSQKIAMSNKYGNIRDSIENLARSTKFDAKDKVQELSRMFWETLINERKVKEELFILNENLAWNGKILSISKKLYVNGKVSQQSLLDIQIRKSEIERQISNKNFELEQISERISYLINDDPKELDRKSIPWSVLSRSGKKRKDYKELSLLGKVKAKDLGVKIAKQNFIPDLTFSVGYTKRANIDNNGDFIGAAITFPIPFSDQKYANRNKEVFEKYAVERKYNNYKRLKVRESNLLQKEISKIEKELSILNTKTIVFATNSRAITSKSYGHGNATYVELLQSELQLQNILLYKVMLEAKKDIEKTNLMYIQGEALNE
ncbi:TolC family protein [Halobacteriovorax sp. HLS]|uniref:TolC family protein n=1 Tax=Halobacteriovorax sp. HLS TaxID=2234000 RepID=UPI000FD95BBE|nr:TolC family protein [Halobacteriovorax sp. HLS]